MKILTELHHEYGLNKYNNIMSEAILANEKIVGGALSFHVRYIKDTLDLNYNMLSSIFSIKDQLDPNRGYLNLINLAEYFKAQEPNVIIDFINGLLTSHVNYYINNVMDIKVNIDDFFMDVEELIPILETRVNKTYLHNMYNLIYDILVYNHKYSKTIMDLIEEDKTILDDDVVLYIIPLIYITPLAAIVGDFPLSNKLNTVSVITLENDPNEHNSLIEIYNKSELFQRYSFIEIVNFHSSNLTGMNVTKVYKTSENVFKLQR